MTTMKLKQLIEKLQRLDQDMDISIEQYEQDNFIGVRLEIGSKVEQQDNYLFRVFWKVWIRP